MKKSEDLTKHTLNLYRGDYTRLQALYPDIGAGAVIRRIVHGFLEKSETAPEPVELHTEVQL